MNCGCIHHELPDIIIPYKRYDSETIAGILTRDADNLQDFPGELSTALRLKLWLFLLCDYIEGTLYALKELYHLKSLLLLPLYPLERQADGWLAALVRKLVNSGRWPQTRSA
ncbi:hypothetical protein SAMN05216529_102345 [Faecalicatena contorta]|uniref:DUF6431 domain-containing protein n=2 Tax=Faecalicatena contorta TaxID=39482 RepID=A0A316A156_9FIRM|nr:hypothetical protein A8805_102345 [Faecalicatena contorta]SUQ13127.1 hypothetical protein SAMN05216529_102345 [Faecalicatena contorta]